MKGGLLLDVVIAQRASIFELLSRENQALLVRRNARVGKYVNEGLVNEAPRGSPFLVLDLGLDIIDSIRGLNLEGDRLPSEAVKGHKYEVSRRGTLDVNTHVLTKICISC